MEAIPDSPSPEALLSHADWVRALARTLVADPHRADDVAQEAWVDVLESPPRDSRNLRGWFASVVRHAALQVGRSEMRRETRERVAAREEALPDTADLVAQASLQRDLVEHVLALDEPYRRTILLRYFQGLEAHEIAEKESVALSTVRTRLQRGIAKLRERLDRAWGDRSSWCAAVAVLGRMHGRPGALAISSAAGLNSWLAGIAACISVAAAAWWIWPRDSAPATSSDLASIEARSLDSQMAEQDLPSGLTPPGTVDRTPVSSPLPTATADASVKDAELPRTRARGRVLDIRGNPIAGLRVRAHDRALPHRDGDSIRWRVGFAGRGILLDPDLERRLREDPSFVEELVSENGNPQGLRDVLLGVDLSVTASTATDGTFELLVPGTDIDVESDDLGWVFASDGWMNLRTLRIFIAAPAIDVSGTVVDPSASPIGGAHAVFGVIPDMLEEFPFTLEAPLGPRNWMSITDAEGKFQLPRIPAIPRGRILGSKEGFRMSYADLPEHSADDLRIVLSPEKPRSRPHVRGMVLDEEGTRVIGATVRLGQDGATTNSLGEFDLVVTTTPNAGTPLSATKPNRQAAVLERFDEQFSGDQEGVEGVVLRLGGEALAITGTILDAEGRPCSGWKVDLEDGTPCGNYTVNLEAATTGRMNERKAPETDSAGRFRVGGLRNRPYRLRAWSERTCLVLVSDPLAAGSIDVEVRVPSDAIRSLLRGSVVSKRGLPVPAAEVCIARVTSRSPGGGYSSVTCRSVLTDAFGRFELSDMPRRNVLLSVQASMIDTVNLEIPAEASGNDVRIEVDVQCRFRLEPRAEDSFDRFVVFDSRGQVVRVTVNTPFSTSIANEVHRSEKGFPICMTSEEAAFLTLFRGKQEIRRVPLDLHPGDLQIVVP
jgi:RNA polymerase sigma-70 factor (ECF subfamily)